MKSYTQTLPRSTQRATLEKTTIFPPNEEGKTATSWNERADGSGNRFASGQESVEVGSSMKLYARYPSQVCTLNYYYTDGHKDSEQICETYVLRNPLKQKPLYSEFKCWQVDGADKVPASVYPWYPTEAVKGDVDALMSADMTCTLSYDSDGGSGSIEAQTASCSKHIDAVSKEVISNAQSVALKANTFTKTDGRFDGWKIDGEVKSPGDTVALTEDKTAVAKWLYQTRYEVTAQSDPNVAYVSVSDFPGLNQKTLIVGAHQLGYEFTKWTDSDGNDVGHSKTQVVTLKESTWSEVQEVVRQVYTAHFQTDSKYTVVSYTDGSTSLKSVSGKLTRTMLESRVQVVAAAAKKTFASVRSVK